MNGLKFMRKAAACTQAELADILGVAQSTVAMWETGKAYPRAELLPIIAKTLNCTIDDLYSGQSA